MKYIDDHGELIVIAVYAVITISIFAEAADMFLQMFGIL